MMTRKTLGILAGAAVVLAATSWLTSRQRYGTAEGGGFEALVRDDLDPAGVQHIRAWVGALPDSSVELARSGDGWVVPTRWNWPARSASSCWTRPVPSPPAGRN